MVANLKFHVFSLMSYMRSFGGLSVSPPSKMPRSIRGQVPRYSLVKILVISAYVCDCSVLISFHLKRPSTGLPATFTPDDLMDKPGNVVEFEGKFNVWPLPNALQELGMQQLKWGRGHYP